MRSWILTLLILAFLSLSRAAQFDLLIKGGRMVNGTGSPVQYADVGILNGKIAAIGKLATATAERTIDARGFIVAPGFIDVHTHAEEILEQPDAENFLRMGVTTLVLGNCGASTDDVEGFFHKLESTLIAPNIATLVGHNTIREEAMGGSFDREPTPSELERMKEKVAHAMKAGALGLSTGLIYLPGTFAKTEEIIDLAKTASQYGGIYATHMRDEGTEIEKSLEEVFRIAAQAQIRAHISHVKLSGKSAWGHAKSVLEQIGEARARGLDITQDQYVYTASSTGIAQLVPQWAREGDKLADRLKDPQTKEKIIAQMKQKLHERGETNYAYAVIAFDREDTSLNGLNIVQAAQKKFGAASLESQIELILDRVSHASPGGIFHGISEEDLQIFLVHPNTMFAADSGIRKFKEGMPHPRGYGNNARVLHRYVNERHLLRLEEAIRKMTSLPASVFRLKNRGQIQEGFWADLVLVDPQNVRDRATFTEPHQYPTGIPFVIVNGVVVVDSREWTGARPGQAVRLQPAF